MRLFVLGTSICMSVFRFINGVTLEQRTTILIYHNRYYWLDKANWWRASILWRKSNKKRQQQSEYITTTAKKCVVKKINGTSNDIIEKQTTSRANKCDVKVKDFHSRRYRPRLVTMKMFDKAQIHSHAHTHDRILIRDLIDVSYFILHKDGFLRKWKSVFSCSNIFIL